MRIDPAHADSKTHTLPILDAWLQDISIMLAMQAGDEPLPGFQRIPDRVLRSYAERFAAVVRAEAEIKSATEPLDRAWILDVLFECEDLYDDLVQFATSMPLPSIPMTTSQAILRLYYAYTLHRPDRRG